MKSRGTNTNREIERKVGARIRQVRVARGLTMEKVSKQAGISKGFLSKIERGDKAPAISTLINVASAMNVNIASLLDPEEKTQRVSFIKANERTVAMRYASAFGYRYASLAHPSGRRHMQPFIVVLPPNPKREGPGLKHPGEEFVMSLKGKILWTVGEQEFVMEPGDALYFDSNLPHWGRSLTRTDAEAIDVCFTPQE